MGKTFALFWFFDRRSTTGGLSEKQHFFANNVAFRKETILRHPFPRLEDGVTRGSCLEPARVLQRHGIDVSRNSSAQVRHPAPNGFRHIVTRAIAEGRNRVFSCTRTRVSYHVYTRCNVWESLEIAGTIVQERKSVGLPAWQLPLALGLCATYQLLQFYGEVRTRANPDVMRRRSQSECSARCGVDDPRHVTPRIRSDWIPSRSPVRGECDRRLRRRGTATPKAPQLPIKAFAGPTERAPASFPAVGRGTSPHPAWVRPRSKPARKAIMNASRSDLDRCWKTRPIGGQLERDWRHVRAERRVVLARQALAKLRQPLVPGRPAVMAQHRLAVLRGLPLPLVDVAGKFDGGTDVVGGIDGHRDTGGAPWSTGSTSGGTSSGLRTTGGPASAVSSSAVYEPN